MTETEEAATKNLDLEPYARLRWRVRELFWRARIPWKWAEAQISAMRQRRRLRDIVEQGQLQLAAAAAAAEPRESEANMVAPAAREVVCASEAEARSECGIVQCGGDCG